MARRPSVKPTASGTGLVLLMGATGCGSVVIIVEVVAGLLESSVDVSVSQRILFGQWKRARIGHCTIYTPIILLHQQLTRRNLAELFCLYHV